MSRPRLTGFLSHADPEPGQAGQIVDDRLTVLRAGMQETLLRMRARLESAVGGAGIEPAAFSV